LITLCLAAILLLTSLNLGAARPDTQSVLLPLYAALLGLHGLWLAIDKDAPEEISAVPLLFCPALLWLIASVVLWSPAPWRGWFEAVNALQLLMVLLVMLNNLRNRYQLYFLATISLGAAAVGIFYGTYQYFQDPEQIAGALTDYGLAMHPDFLGQATGTFASPISFATLLLILLPILLAAGSVGRLPAILRVFAIYLAIMMLFAIGLTKSLAAACIAVVILAAYPWLCLRTLRRKLLVSLLGFGLAASGLVAMFLFHPGFQRIWMESVSPESVGARLTLWEEALAMFAQAPVLGVGAGAYGLMLEQSPRVALAENALTPHNDYLLVLSQLGAVGFILLVLPTVLLIGFAWKRWRAYPYRVLSRGSNQKCMHPKRFLLSVGLCGMVGVALALGVSFIFYVPALGLYALVVFATVIKAGACPQIRFPRRAILRVSCALLACGAAFGFYSFAAPKLEAQALELRARQSFEGIIQSRAHIAGRTELLEEVIALYEEAVLLDPENVDAWIGLSAARGQRYFQTPEALDSIAARSMAAAERAIELSPDYWKARAQLGVCHALSGDEEAAELAFRRMLDLAPNNSNAHYYWAAFLGGRGDQRQEALASVERALDINPENAAAQRLQQKLRIP
jgi:O-antigen ligase/cytochrome c-type biogenesis protein CcmH/NrfG